MENKTLTAEEYRTLCIASQVLSIPFLELEIEGEIVKHPKTGRAWESEWNENN